MMSGLRADRKWIAGAVAVAVAMVAASWFLVISPKLDDAATVRANAAAAADQNDVLQAKVDKLRVESASLPKLVKDLDTLQVALPPTSSLDAFTRQLTQQAAHAKVTVTSIVIGTPTAVKADAAAKPATAAGDAANGSTNAAKDAASAGTGAAAPASGSASDAGSSSGTDAAKASAAGLFTIPVTLIADGTFGDLQALLGNIQTAGARGALISSAQFAPAAGADGSAASANAAGPAAGAGAVAPAPPAAGPAAAKAAPMTMTVQLAVFVAPQTPQAAAALHQQLGG